MTCKLSELISPAFFDVHRQIKAGKVTELLAKGGRGSTKSSYISLELILQLLLHPQCHAIVLRKVDKTLRTSVYAQICWAIAALGLGSRFKCTVSSSVTITSMRMSIIKGTYSNAIYKIGIVAGSQIKPWAPYVEPQHLPIPTPDGLPGIPVDSGGNWVDETGQQWVSDFIDLAAGTKTQNIADLVITGDMLEQFIASTQYGNYARITENRIKQTDIDSKMVICDRFVGVSFNSRIRDPDTYRIFQETSGDVSYIALRWTASSNTDFETMKNELNANHAHAIFILAAPITTPLDAETIAAYKALQSYPGTTNVLAPDCGIEAAAVAEPNQYIEDKIQAAITKAVTQAVELTGGNI